MVVLAAAQGVFHLLRAMTGAPVRLTAFGDVVFRGASLTLLGWIWLYSPFASLLRVDNIASLIERTETLFRRGEGGETVLILVFGVILVSEVSGLLMALRRLAFGK